VELSSREPVMVPLSNGTSPRQRFPSEDGAILPFRPLRGLYEGLFAKFSARLVNVTCRSWRTGG
jgi:hypothetical protein